MLLVNSSGTEEKMKKVLAALLTVAMLAGAMASTVLARDFYIEQDIRLDDSFALGDVNEDGALDAKDALYMTANLKGLDGYTMNAQSSDFTADSVFDAKDFYYIKLCLSGAASPEDYGDDLAVYKLTIGGNDLSKYSIVVPADTSEEENIWFAYQNLMKYIRTATGVTIPLCYGEANTEKYIAFHDVEMNSERGEYLGVEGYQYDIVDGNIDIYGTYRGNMYAVFDILEDYLGYRFYSGRETFVYKNRTVDIPDNISAEVIPALNFRYARQTFGSGYVPGHFFPNKLNGSQVNGYDAPYYGTKTGPFYSNAHSFVEYWQMGTGIMPTDPNMSEQQKLEAKFASGTAPSAYSWQPCATSDEDYYILFNGMLECNRMRQFWDKYNVIYYEHEITVFSFSIADNQSYHTCRNCNQISQGNEKKGIPAEGYSGLYLQLYNRAAEEVQQYYPGIRLYGIVYAKDFPATIKPHDQLIILYCGIGCNNHILGQEECYPDGGQLNGMSNDDDLFALKYWGNLCKETGAELWFWVYPVTYHYYLTSCPNVLNLYPNLKWLCEEANVTGIFYEGGGTTYNFETLKEWIAVKFMWDTDMTEEECHDVIMEYLYMNYGDGGEELYKYIEMQTEAGDLCGTCFINNFDRPGDMYSYEYLAEHYEEMRDLLEVALTKAKNSDQRGRIETLIVCCDFMGLSSVHTDWYVNGKNRELYEERYTWMYNYIKDHNMRVFSDATYALPSSIDFEENPMIQIYGSGSRRDGIYP